MEQPLSHKKTSAALLFTLTTLLSLNVFQIHPALASYAAMVTFYNGTNQTGASRTYNEVDQSDFGNDNFDNMARSFGNLRGGCLLYSEKNFNPMCYGSMQAFWTYSPSFLYSDNLYYSDSSSFRFFGDLQNFSEPCMSLYSCVYYMGSAQKTNTDKPDLTITEAKSCILTGNYNWTVYSGINYTGASTCIKANSQSLHPPVLISNTTASPGPGYPIKSVRKGCFSGSS